MTREKIFKLDDWDAFQKQQDYHAEQSVRLDQVEMEPVEWLWPGFIPKGMVTILTGEEGLGKSQLAMKIAASFSSEERWAPGGNPQDDSPGGLVKLYSAEDPLKQVLTPRMKANGANMRHVFAEGINIETFLPEGIDDPDPTKPSIARGIDELGIGMIVIDPVIAYVGAKHDSNSAQDVRYIMRKLADLAEVSNTVILGVMHPKKGEETQALHKMIGGSSAFGQAARSVLGVARHPDEEDQRIVGRIKGNLDRSPIPYIYEIVSTTLKNSHGVSIPTSKVRFVGQVEEGFDLIAAVQGRPQPHSRDEDGDAAYEYDRLATKIVEKLQRGVQTRKALWDFARADGFKEGTFKNALRALRESNTVKVGQTDEGLDQYSLQGGG